MGIVGFVDNAGQRLTFAQVAAGEGNFRTRNGHPVPRPVLRALAAGYRSEDHYGDKDAVSVTTLIAPVQLKHLERRHDYYVDPLANLWSKWGTIEHAMYEQFPSAGDIVERKLLLRSKVTGLTIAGTFDLLERVFAKEDVAIFQGRDYKVTSAYGVKGMLAEGIEAAKPEYFWQANIYRYMAEHPDTVELFDNGEGQEILPWTPVKIDNWALVAVSRDYNKRQHGVHFGPVELVQVPLIDKRRVGEYIKERMLLWQASAMCDDGGLPHCSPEETWQGRRCADYCPVAERCHQFDPTLGME
jgi:hypothetical protein